MPKSVNKLFLSLAFGISGILILLSIINIVDDNKAAKSTATPVVKQANKLTYKGEGGKDALAVLKEHATVKQNASGLVVSINNRQADNKKHEYWAFLINGKMASVGPKDYLTKSTDTIVWEIQKY
jgi:hypothetical protein